jgi:membrane protease YdiL (CAAX protease family)
VQAAALYKRGMSRRAGPIGAEPQGARLQADSPTVSAATLPAPAVRPPEEPVDVREARSKIVRTVFASIGLGLAVLIVTLAANDADADVAHRLAAGMAVTLTLYAFVSLLVGRRLDAKVIRPRLVEGPVGRAIGIGALCGAATGIVVSAFVSLLSGELTSDPDMVAIASERLWMPIVAIVFVAVIAAPVIEEMLFRGLLVEAYRSRGRTSAILMGAVAFSFWHLNPAALRYYVLMGFLLGYLYWRLGLAGSISAHVAFNGVLVVLSFVSLVGGPETVKRDGIAIDVPRSWHVVDDPIAESIDLALESPTGSAIVVERVGAAQLESRGFPSSTAALTRLPQGATEPRAIRVDGGPAVRFSLTLGSGTASDVVVVPKGSGVFVLTLVDGGSAQAGQRFLEILASVRLPLL